MRNKYFCIVIYFVFYLFYVYSINAVKHLSQSYVNNDDNYNYQRKRKLLASSFGSSQPHHEKFMSLYFVILSSIHYDTTDHAIAFEVKYDTTNNDLYEIVLSSITNRHYRDPKIILSSHGRVLPIDDTMIADQGISAESQIEVKILNEKECLLKMFENVIPNIKQKLSWNTNESICKWRGIYCDDNDIIFLKLVFIMLI